MSSQIVFLGTGTGPAVVGKGIRSSGGIILKSGDNQFHIDPGIGAIYSAAQHGINLRANTAILLSHSHINHSNDVNAVIDAMTYGGLDKQGLLLSNHISIQGTDENPPIVPMHFRNLLERFIVVDLNQRIGINEIEVQTLRTKHAENNTLGFKIYTPEFTVTYSSDTAYSAEIAEQYMGSHILILNVPNTKKTDQNLCLEDAINLIKKASPKLAILTHFGSEMIKADPLYEVREVQKQTGVQTIAAKDGMTLNTASYAVAKGQKTLQGYKE